MSATSWHQPGAESAATPALSVSVLPAWPPGLELRVVLLEMARVTSELLSSWGTSFPGDLLQDLCVFAVGLPVGVTHAISTNSLIHPIPLTKAL